MTRLFNAILRLEYYPSQWKVSQTMVIPKPGKPPNDVGSYRPIRVLPVLSKVFEKLLLKLLNPVIHETNVVPDQLLNRYTESYYISTLFCLYIYLSISLYARPQNSSCQQSAVECKYSIVIKKKKYQ